MRVRAASILAGAWAAWRADWAMLTAVAGVFAFLPSFAYGLFVPALPQLAPDGGAPDAAAMAAFEAALKVWIGQYGGWYVALAAVILFSQFALVALYVTPHRATAGRALAGAARLFPRMLGASLAWAMPVGLACWVLVQLGLTLATMPVYALALARTCLIGPALIAERPIGAFAAVGRSFRLTRGHMPMLASLLLGVILVEFLLGLPFDAADGWLKLHGPNPVVRAMVEAAAAGVAMLGTIAVALIEVAAWRRLSAA